MLVVKRVNVTYHLKVDADVDRDAIDRVMAVHAESCPVYRSIHPQIEVSTALEVETLA